MRLVSGRSAVRIRSPAHSLPGMRKRHLAEPRPPSDRCAQRLSSGDRRGEHLEPGVEVVSGRRLRDKEAGQPQEIGASYIPPASRAGSTSSSPQSCCPLCAARSMTPCCPSSAPSGSPRREGRLTATSSAEGFPSFRRALLLIPPLVDLRKLACGERESNARETGRNCLESGKIQVAWQHA